MMAGIQKVTIEELRNTRLHSVEFFQLFSSKEEGTRFILQDTAAGTQKTWYEVPADTPAAVEDLAQYLADVFWIQVQPGAFRSMARKINAAAHRLKTNGSIPFNHERQADNVFMFRR